MLNEFDEDDSRLKYTVALSHRPQTINTPKLIAMGRGLIANLITQLAEKNNIPVYENQELSEVLNKLEAEADIPVEAYNAVAEIIAYILKKQ